MAWRPTHCLIEGELDNTVPGKVTGWMQFAGLKKPVKFNLKGDFHRDIRGAKIHFHGDGAETDATETKDYMQGLAPTQKGDVGDITAGLPSHDYTKYPYIEWYSQNGRVVLELDPDQITVIGTPIPWVESDPVSREQQARNMSGFMQSISDNLRVPGIVVGNGEPETPPTNN